MYVNYIILISYDRDRSMLSFDFCEILIVYVCVLIVLIGMNKFI